MATVASWSYFLHSMFCQFTNEWFITYYTYLNTTNTYHGCSYIQGVRVVMVGAYSVEKLGNRELRKEWVSNMTKKALENHADGINIDIEEPVPKGSKEETLLTMLVNETTRAFHDAIKGSQVSRLMRNPGGKQPSQNQAVGSSLSRLLEIFDCLLSTTPHSIFLQMAVTQPIPPNK